MKLKYVIGVKCGKNLVIGFKGVLSRGDDWLLLVGGFFFNYLWNVKK